MSLDAELALTYKFANCPVLAFPYPHFFIEDVFPQDFYARLQNNIPDPSIMVPIADARPVKGSDERFVLDLGDEKHRDKLPEDRREFWKEFASWLCSGRLANLALQKFQPMIQQRFRNGPPPTFYNEALLVQDITKYSLGPHTDSPKKVITMLFYLPKDLSQEHIGTSMYLPKDPSFRCPGGPHYGYDNFARINTMPFKPNSLFGFVKTDNSFHGVEPVVDPETRRWLLLYDVYAEVPQPQAAGPAKGAAQPTPNVAFKF